MKIFFLIVLCISINPTISLSAAALASTGLKQPVPPHDKEAPALFSAQAGEHVRSLVRAKADVLYKSQGGKTALHAAFARRNDDPGLFFELCNEGADASAITDSRKTVLHSMISSYRTWYPPEAPYPHMTTVMALLLLNGCEPGHKNSKNKSSFDLLQESYPDLVEPLKKFHSRVPAILREREFFKQSLPTLQMEMSAVVPVSGVAGHVIDYVGSVCLSINEVNNLWYEAQREKLPEQQLAQEEGSKKRSSRCDNCKMG